MKCEHKYETECVMFRRTVAWRRSWVLWSWSWLKQRAQWSDSKETWTSCCMTRWHSTDTVCCVSSVVHTTLRLWAPVWPVLTLDTGSLTIMWSGTELTENTNQTVPLTVKLTSENKCVLSETLSECEQKYIFTYVLVCARSVCVV